MRYSPLTQSEKETIALESATLMVYRDFTLWDISDYINVPMSTLYKCMVEEMPRLNAKMFRQVRKKLDEHKRRGGRHS